MLSSVQRRKLLQEQTIKADILRDWIDKIREAFERTLLYKNFVDGLAKEGLEQYIAEHPHDKDRAADIEGTIGELIATAQNMNRLLSDLDQRIGTARPAPVEPTPAKGASETEAEPEVEMAEPEPEAEETEPEEEGKEETAEEKG